MLSAVSVRRGCTFIIFIYGIIYLKKTTKKLIPNFIWNQYVKIRVSINKRNQKKIQDNEYLDYYKLHEFDEITNKIELKY